jgi:death-on-curing protein
LQVLLLPQQITKRGIMYVNDLFEIAAWYGIALAKGHAFVDGNKRTGLAVMLTFLEIQGVSIHESTGLDDLMVDIVESQDQHEDLAKIVSDFLYELSEI